MDEYKSRVYILVDNDNYITRLDGEYSLPSDLSGWILIEEGAPCDRLNLAQAHYLNKPLIDRMSGEYNYQYINGEIVEKE